MGQTPHQQPETWTATLLWEKHSLPTSPPSWKASWGGITTLGTEGLGDVAHGMGRNRGPPSPGRARTQSESEAYAVPWDLCVFIRDPFGLMPEGQGWSRR